MLIKSLLERTNKAGEFNYFIRRERKYYNARLESNFLFGVIFCKRYLRRYNNPAFDFCNVIQLTGVAAIFYPQFSWFYIGGVLQRGVG